MIVKELHESHPEISSMKSLAIVYVWWPDLDQWLEEQICNVLLSTGMKQTTNSTSSSLGVAREAMGEIVYWLSRSMLWEVFLGTCWFPIQVVEVHLVSYTTNAVTIEKLRFIFLTHRLPNMIVSDNESVFTNTKFSDFMTYNGNTHVKLSPYHPSTNGLAEWVVQTFKAGIKKQTEGTLELKLSHFLFHYRWTSLTMTGQSPPELLLGRHIKFCLDLLHPNRKTKVAQNLWRQKLNHESW